MSDRRPIRTRGSEGPPDDLADIVERTDALPAALRDRVVRAWSHALIAAEQEAPAPLDYPPHGIGRRLTDR